MSPEEKANELIERFSLEIVGQDHFGLRKLNAKQCGLICVEEILKLDVLNDEDIYVMTPNYRPFWNEVKKILTNS